MHPNKRIMNGFYIQPDDKKAFIRSVNEEDISFNSKEHEVKPWDLRGGYHALTIRKIDKTVYFFYNGEFCFEYPFVGYEGNRIAMGIPKHTHIQIDYLKVVQLNLPREPLLDRITNSIKNRWQIIIGLLATILTIIFTINKLRTKSRS